MGLLRNGSSFAASPTRFMGGISTLSLDSVRLRQFGERRNFWAGEATRDAQQNAFPPGYLHPTAWLIAPKPGGLSSHKRAQGTSTATATLAEGRALAVTTDGTSTVTGTLSSIYAMVGTSDGVATATGTLSISVSLTGTSTGVGTATGTLSAIFSMTGTAAGTSTATAPPNYLVNISGSVELTTVDAGALTAEDIKSAVWGAAAASFDTAATMGRALNDSKAAASNRMVLNYSTGVLTIYEADGVTARATFTMRDRNGDASSTEQMEREPD